MMFFSVAVLNSLKKSNFVFGIQISPSYYLPLFTPTFFYTFSVSTFSFHLIPIYFVFINLFLLVKTPPTHHPTLHSRHLSLLLLIFYIPSTFYQHFSTFISTPLLHLHHTSSTPHPHLFHTSSRPLPHHLHTSTTPLPHHLHTTSTPPPHLFNTTSTPPPHLFHTTSTPLQHHLFHTTPTPLQHHLHTSSTLPPHLHHTTPTPPPHLSHPPSSQIEYYPSYGHHQREVTEVGPITTHLLKGLDTNVPYKV